MHSHSCRQLHWPHKTTDIKPKTILQWASTTTMIGRSFQLKFNKPVSCELCSACMCMQIYIIIVSNHHHAPCIINTQDNLTLICLCTIATRSSLNAYPTAAALGYNKSLWDKDDEPDACDEYWKDLTPAQQQAATVLGYNKKSWDKS